MVVTTVLAGYFYWQTQQLQPRQTVEISPKIAPAPSPNSPAETKEATATPSVPAKNIPQAEDLPQLKIAYAPKADWATYTAEDLRLTFQYKIESSSEFSYRQMVQPRESGQSINVSTCSIPTTGPTAGQEFCLPFYSYKLYDNYTGGSRRVWFNTYMSSLNHCPRYYADVALAGKKALLVTSDCSSFGETFVLIPRVPHMVVFSTFGYIRDPQSGKITLPDYASEVLATLKFL